MRTFALVLAFGAFLFGPPDASGQVIKAEAKTRKNEILLTFEASVRPSDPFHDLNAPGAPAKAVKGFAPGETFLIAIRGTLAKGYHTYPLISRTEVQPIDSLSEIRYASNPHLLPLLPVEESPAELVDTMVSGIWREYVEPFTWTQEVYIDPKAPAGKLDFTMTIRTQICDHSGCTWLETPLKVSVTVLEEPAMAPSSELQKRVEKSRPPAIPDVVPPDASNKPFDFAALGWFVLQGMFWGGVSLITPCVFPMIPITVSFFLKQAEKRTPGSAHHSALTLAIVYTATVVIVLTLAAVALLSAFRWLSTFWLMNAFLGALFIYFALSLFGLYDIELPGWMADFTSSRERKGGLVGTIFMALTFTIISFACVAPFLGGFGGTASGSNLSFWHRLAGGFAFAATFAAPFFFLALFPSLLKAMPRGGDWMDSVKVVMGFLELAAAFKFFRQAEIAYHTPQFFTYELVMASYIGLSVLVAAYLVGVFTLPHEKAGQRVSVAGAMLGLAFLSFALYLTPALFKTYNARGERTYPSGIVFAWVDAFMLPDTTGDVAPLTLSPGQPARETWHANLKKALAQASAGGKLVFVDFTGETCTNCKLNERNIFPKPAVRELFDKYVLVQLYTDRIPDRFYSPSDMPGTIAGARGDAEKNLRYQRERFDTEQLPLYAILQPTGPQTTEAVGTYQGASWLPDQGFKILGKYEEGLIQSESAFVAFLGKFLGKK